MADEPREGAGPDGPGAEEAPKAEATAASASAEAAAKVDTQAETSAKADAPAASGAAPEAEAKEPEVKEPEAKEPEAKEPEAKEAPSRGAGVELDVVGRTDVGLVREHNEDSYLVLRLDENDREPASLRHHTLGLKGTLCVVCDGMGGAAAGEVASSMAVESISTTMLSDRPAQPPEGVVDDARTALGRKLRMAARDANGQIFREARANLARSGMGTTMTAVLFQGDHAVIAQVGDSRAYVWRDGRFTQVTRDQSLVNQLLETGHITPEQAKFFEHSNVILQALGVQEDVEVQLSKVELKRGDRFLVCSDGLVGVVTDEEIGAVMGACEDPDETARILIEMANGAGGPDNISVIVAYVSGEAAPEPTDADHLTYQLWRIDPEPAQTEVSDSPTSPTVGARAIQHAPEHPPVRRLQRRNPTVELVSMAVVFGLVLGSVMTGAVLYRNGVSCQVRAPKEGLSLMADGRDTGVRTPASDGAPVQVRVRLRPGHHTLSLRGVGAPDAIREIEVTSGGLCEAAFDEPRAEVEPARLPTAVVPGAPTATAAAAPAPSGPVVVPHDPTAPGEEKVSAPDEPPPPRPGRAEAAPAGDPAKAGEAPKAEAPKPATGEAPKAEAQAAVPTGEAPKAEPPRAEAKGVAPTGAAPKVEAPKAEAPKAEAPKAEAPKSAPKVEAPKPEPAKPPPAPSKAEER